MQHKQAEILSTICLAVAVILLIVYFFTRLRPLPFLAVAVMVAGTLFVDRYRRCPKCGRSGRRLWQRDCPYCGEHVLDD